MKENKLQTDCIRYLKQQGIYHINIHGGGWGAKGAPDLIACIDGKFVAFELKVGENEMDSAQEIHRDRILQSGGQHYCPRSLREFMLIVRSEVKHNEKTNVL